jgi:hypothetical protein
MVDEPDATAAPEVESLPETMAGSDYEASAAEQLAKLEDKLFGDRCGRVDGKIERGSGSLFQRLSPEDKATYEALEAQVEAEVQLAAAQAQVSAAQAAVKAAQERCDALKAKG